MRVLVVDSQPQTRDGVRMDLVGAGVVDAVAEAADIATAAPLVATFRPHVLLLGDHGALGFIRELRERHTEVRVLVLSQAPPAEILPAIRAGAHGYISRASTSAELARAVTDVRDGPVVPERDAVVIGEPCPAAGIRRLTARERDVLRCLAEAYDNHEIGAELGIAVRTVNRHLEAIRAKLGTRRRSHLVRLARTAHAC